MANEHVKAWAAATVAATYTNDNTTTRKALSASDASRLAAFLHGWNTGKYTNAGIA